MSLTNTASPMAEVDKKNQVWALVEECYIISKGCCTTLDILAANTIASVKYKC